MSHYFALAFVTPNMQRQGAQAIAVEVARLMEPYNIHAASATAGEEFNPHGQWDAWEIGGRNDGVIMGRVSLSKESDDRSEEGVLARNLCAVSDLPEDMVPFAVVTPDGAWHMEGVVGTFGDAFDLDMYWEDKYDELCERYADCLAVGLDCHI